MKKEITIPSSDGGAFMAYVSYPQGAQPAPAVIVIQEIFGVNAVMRKICDDLAAQGYIAVCPDLFWRQEPGVNITDQTKEEWDKAFALYNGFDVDLGVEDLKAALAFTRKEINTTGKVGSIGFCLGGKLAYLMSTRSDADCSVSYYGVELDKLLDEPVRRPLLMHVAEKDKFVPPEAREKIVAHLKPNPLVALYVYEGADHAFGRIGSDHYNAPAAELAGQRTADFLRKHLG